MAVQFGTPLAQASLIGIGWRGSPEALFKALAIHPRNSSNGPGAPSTFAAG